MKTWTLAVVVLLGLASSAAAQDGSGSFGPPSGRLKPGTTVFVIDRNGHETTGVLRRVTPTSIVIAPGGPEVEIPFTSIGRIEKRDRVLNGPLIGAAIGAFLGQGLGRLACDTDCAPAAGVGAAIFGGIGAAIGAIGDAGVKGRDRLYTAASDPGRLGSGNAFADLWATLKTGDSVEVVGADGHKTTGKFVSVSGSSMVLMVDGQQREVPETGVRRIVRRRDSLWNGAAVGAGIGVLGALGCGAPRNCGGEVVADILVWGLLGAGVDALIGRSELAYVSAGAPQARASRVNLAVSGVLAPQRKAVGLAVSF